MEKKQATLEWSTDHFHLIQIEVKPEEGVAKSVRIAFRILGVGFEITVGKDIEINVDGGYLRIEEFINKNEVLGVVTTGIKLRLSRRPHQ